MLALINDAGITMRDGRYVATLEQLQKLVVSAKNIKVVDQAYDYFTTHSCTQAYAAARFGISQPALSQYIRRQRNT